jgi:hypothetical protein
MFPVSAELQYEYVMATIVVKEQKLMIRWISSTIGSHNCHAITMTVHDVVAVIS